METGAAAAGERERSEDPRPGRKGAREMVSGGRKEVPGTRAVDLPRRRPAGQGPSGRGGG